MARPVPASTSSLALPLPAYVERLVNRVRWIAIAILLPYMAWFQPAWAKEPAVVAVILGATAYTAFLEWYSRRPTFWPWVPHVTSWIDVGMVLVACASTGGVASSFHIFLLLVPLTSAMRLDARLVFAYSLGSAVAFLGLAAPGGITRGEVEQCALFIMALVLMGLASGLLGRRVLHSQEELERKVAARTEALREANERLQALDRLKQEFVSNVSHELRTPLTSIRGYAEFLEDEVGGPLAPPQAEFVGHIQDGAIRLQRLVDDLLDFARLEAGTFRLEQREADMRAVVARALASVQPQAAGAGVRLEVDVPVTFGRIMLDPERIEQVLLNLVGNAIKFTPPGGRVQVSLRKADGFAQVEVADSGIGIDAEALPRLFDKFFQADTSSTRAYGGAGLGLAICKAIVEAHGGTIAATSQAGHGSTFVFTVPLAASAPSVLAPAEA